MLPSLPPFLPIIAGFAILKALAFWFSPRRARK